MFIITTDHAGIPDIVGTENGIILKSDAKINDLIGNIQKNKNLEVLQVCNRNRIEVKTFFKQANYLSNMEEAFSETLLVDN